jgi:hypothetical protein
MRPRRLIQRRARRLNAGVRALLVRLLKIMLPLVVAPLTSGCEHTMFFQFDTIVAGKSLELRNDHTFAYKSWADTIGDDCSAQGVWERINAKALSLQVLTTQGPQGCGESELSGQWVILRNEIVQVSEAIPRVSRPR